MNAPIRFVLLAALSFLGCQAPLGSGTVISQDREVTSFRRLAIGSGISARGAIGTRAVKITSDDNVVPLVQTFVTGETLHVQLKPGVISPLASTLVADISNDLFEALDASGGADVTLDATTVDDFPVTASGGSSVHVSRLAAQTLTVEATGGSSVTLTGSARSAHLGASGGSDLHLRDVPLTSASLDASGGSTIFARVSATLTGAASGGSTVTVVGAPANQVQVTGGSEVHLNAE